MKGQYINKNLKIAVCLEIAVLKAKMFENICMYEKIWAF